ncbi:MAG: tRNA-dihydrouridine synthase family protein [Desulfobacteraceae bacterium]|nr:tRNA-dihydrouridine synthase family protein [Desulfobacteraceae bacterium]
MNNKNITIILAPLQGFTDVTFRNVWARHFTGIDEAIAPFISTMGQQRLKPSRIKDVAPENNQHLFVIPQILGNVSTDFIFLADHLYEMGHKRINWNLGCPHSKIAKKHRGSGLLPYPAKIDELLTQIIPNISADLSVKIRLGRRSKDEIFNLLTMFDRHPLEEIILHPRTGIQMYEGTSDQDAFEKAIENSRHTFTYNGDIIDIDSFKTVQERFPGITRFMIGRGILANPFLAEEIKGTPKNTTPRPTRLKAFHDELFAQYDKIFSGPAHLTGRMKGFWTYLGPSFKESKKPLKQILKSTSIPAYQDRVEAFFDQKLEFGP